MNWLVDFYGAYPLLVWLAIGALFLAAEVSTGSGWLLWPAGAAAALAVLTLVLPDSLMLELGLFAAITAVSALLGRRFLPKGLGSGPDINDNMARLVGQYAVAVSRFDNGRGRVFIDGKEWAAVADGADPKADQRVEVIAAEGAVLRVRVA
ncbi:MAG TPA: NfeD family protein [Caulobacteraceae bacterium]|nr:NfeD family protein [Caulobacteraceae bacterium]